MNPSGHRRRPISVHARIRHATYAVAAALSCALALSCSDLTAPEPLEGYRFLFLSHAEGERPDIYRMSPDDPARERLTTDGWHQSMSLSPDGKRVTFVEGCSFIWTMNVDGTSAVRHNTYEERCNRMPRWSPDGRYIAFNSTRDGSYGMWVMNADGTNPHKVASSTYPGGTVPPFGWTPDGRVVFFDRDETVVSTYSVNPDGTDRRRILPMEGDHSPRWSRDGSKVAFIRDTEGSSLHVMNADGTNVRRLTNHDGLDDLIGDYLVENDHSYWSADGSQLVFYRTFPNVGSQLHVIRADGTGLVNLTAGAESSDATFNGWAPDGRITLHRNGPSGAADIFLVNADGTGLVNLTNSATWDFNALWIPR